MLMSLFREFLIDDNSLSIWSVRDIVPAPGCFVTVISTAGIDFSEATPSLGDSEPVRITATSERSIVPFVSLRITALESSSIRFVFAFPLIIYSFP